MEQYPVLRVVVFMYITRVGGHYYPAFPNQYFAQQTQSVYHNVGGSFGFGIPLSGFQSPMPEFPFRHINWIGKPASSNDFIPNELKPSIVGWDTTYNVPCGSYTIHPFVIAHLRYKSGGRFRKHQWQRTEGRSFFTPKVPNTCTWEFKAFASCKLKFLCTWVQLPALFKCEENYMELTDSDKFSYKFCGSRKPRGPYVSPSERLKLTFRSGSQALPAVFDCAVSCGLEALNYGATLTNEVSSSITRGNVMTQYYNRQYNIATFATGKPEITGTPTSTSTEAALKLISCKCGKRGHPDSSRIVGGSHTLPGEFPWVAALVRKNSNQPFCGGSLINDRYIITAAHCVQKYGLADDPIEVLLNEHDFSLSNRTVRIKIVGIIIHPKYDKVTYDHDIALVRLAGVIDIGDPISESTSSSTERSRSGDILPEYGNNSITSLCPICLPFGKWKSEEDQHAIVTGWGLTKEGGIPSNTMMQASVEIFNHTTCQQLYKSNSVITNQMMCAGDLKGKMDSCVGDSGGPLIVNEDGRYILAGIVSWGRGCARPNLPGVYTRLEGLADWIRSNTYEDSSWCTE